MRGEPELPGEGPVAETALSSLNGKRGELRVRGYRIEECAHRLSFEEACLLLWDGELPGAKRLSEFRAGLAPYREIPEDLALLALPLAEGDPLRALRALLALCPRLHPRWPKTPRTLALATTALTPGLCATLLRARDGLPPVPSDPNLPLAEDFLRMCRGGPAKAAEDRALEASWILHLENGLNASSFAARVAASTGASLDAAVIAALATLEGPRHGGANRAVHAFLRDLEDPSEAPRRVDRALEAGERIPGFGHRVFEVDDPRAVAMRSLGEELRRFLGKPGLFPRAEALAEALRSRRPLVQNIDLWSAPLWDALGFPPAFFPCLFAIGRMPGWTAHALEAREGRMIRPRAAYAGPPPRSFPEAS